MIKIFLEQIANLDIPPRKKKRNKKGKKKKRNCKTMFTMKFEDFRNDSEKKNYGKNNGKKRNFRRHF